MPHRLDVHQAKPLAATGHGEHAGAGVNRVEFVLGNETVKKNAPGHTRLAGQCFQFLFAGPFADDPQPGVGHGRHHRRPGLDQLVVTLVTLAFGDSSDNQHFRSLAIGRGVRRRVGLGGQRADHRPGKFAVQALGPSAGILGVEQRQRRGLGRPDITGPGVFPDLDAVKEGQEWFVSQSREAGDLGDMAAIGDQMRAAGEHCPPGEREFGAARHPDREIEIGGRLMVEQRQVTGAIPGFGMFREDPRHHSTHSLDPPGARPQGRASKENSMRSRKAHHDRSGQERESTMSSCGIDANFSSSASADTKKNIAISS